MPGWLSLWGETWLGLSTITVWFLADSSVWLWETWCWTWTEGLSEHHIYPNTLPPLGKPDCTLARQWKTHIICILWQPIQDKWIYLLNALLNIMALKFGWKNTVWSLYCLINGVILDQKFFSPKRAANNAFLCTSRICEYVHTNIRTFKAAGVVHSLWMGLFAVASLCELPPKRKLCEHYIRKAYIEAVWRKICTVNTTSKQAQLIYYHIKLTERGSWSLCSCKL